MLNFSLLSIPQIINSVSISAVAIDPYTAHTALSGDVNNHYLLRYGSLFASSFLQGYAQAETSGTKSCIAGVCFFTQDQLSSTQKFHELV